MKLLLRLYLKTEYLKQFQISVEKIHMEQIGKLRKNSNYHVNLDLLVVFIVNILIQQKKFIEILVIKEIRGINKNIYF